MVNGYKYIALLTIILFLFQTKMHAQNIATSVMNVTVEVVSGSTVEMNSHDWITFQDEAPDSKQYAIITIRHQEQSSILTSSSDSVTLINGVDQFEMSSSMSELKNDSGDIELHFSARSNSSAKGGMYSGKQIAEIIYL